MELTTIVRAPPQFTVIFASISIPLLRTLPGLMALHAYYGMTIINSTLIVIALTLAYANLTRILRNTRYNIRQYRPSAALAKQRRVAKIRNGHRYFIHCDAYPYDCLPYSGTSRATSSFSVSTAIRARNHIGMRNSVIARVRSFSYPHDFNLQINHALTIVTTLPSDPHDPGKSHSTQDDGPSQAIARPRSGISNSIYSPTTFKRIIPTPILSLLTSSPLWPDPPSFLIGNGEPGLRSSRDGRLGRIRTIGLTRRRPGHSMIRMIAFGISRANKKYGYLSVPHPF